MVYGYIRVSTDKQDGAAQKIGIEEFCRKRNLAIDEYIDDEGKSGCLEPERRELGRLLKKLKPGDILVSGEISRLGRSLFMIMRILEHCMNNNVKVYTVKDGYELGDNITSKVLAFAFGLSAEIEREMISRRTKEGLIKAKESGKQIGRVRGSKNSYYKPTKYHDRILELLDEGTPVMEIARRCGVNVTTLWRYLKRIGVTVDRSKSCINRHRLCRTRQDMMRVETDISELLVQGLSKKEIARRIGMSYPTALRYIRQMEMGKTKQKEAGK